MHVLSLILFYRKVRAGEVRTPYFWLSKTTTINIGFTFIEEFLIHINFLLMIQVYQTELYYSILKSNVIQINDQPERDIISVIGFFACKYIEGRRNACEYQP